MESSAVFSAGQIREAVGGRLLWGASGMEAAGVSADTRTLAAGELYVPLVGPNFDGHDFIGEALAAGAAGVLVGAGRPAPETAGAFAVEAADTLTALGDLALHHRRRFGLPVAAVTGSNGKTTTKEMLAAILAEGGETLKSEGNLNNFVGLPLQVLRLGPAHDRAVFEMGMNRPGEIRRLTEIAAPDGVVITNVAPVHLEGLGSLEAVREAQGEALEEMGPSGWAVLHTGDAESRELARRFRAAGGRVRTFGFSEESDVRAGEIRAEGAEGARFLLQVEGWEGEVRLPAVGRHNVANARAAAAAAQLMGASWEEAAAGLARAEIPGMRMAVEEIRAPAGCRLLNDAYNANPASLRQALETAGALRGGGRLFALLGDMKELGDFAEEAHREAGRAAASAGDGVFLAAVGPMMALAAEAAREAGMPADRVARFETPEEAAAWAAGRLRPGDWALVKGSRSMEMERAVEALRG